MSAWQWSCADDHERIGLELVLTRAGVAYVVREEGSDTTTTIRVDGDTDRVRELERRMLAGHARRLDRELGARLDRREQRGRHALAVLVSVLTVLLGIAVLLRLY